MTTLIHKLRADSPLYLAFLFSLTLIGGCSEYELTLNEKTLYDPTELRRLVSLEDKALEKCVKSTLAEKGITRAHQLTSLHCGPGTISQLEGLQMFGNIESIGVAENQIADIKSLLALPKLRQLDLSNNAISTAESLQALNALEYLNLEGNDELNCSSITWATKRTSLTLKPPKHCENRISDQ